MKTPIKFILSFALLLLAAADIAAQELITNVYGRDVQSLNGKWDAIVDLYDQGRKNKIYLNRKPEGKTDFYEYSFDNGLRLDVPSDWNCQMPELKYYEGTVWYARRFDAPEQAGRRQFLYFGAVSYRCRVYLNGEEIGAHEGGFTPFEIEVTGRLKPEGNFLAVEVNNTRTTDAIPAMAFDWWNYGGITRDVMLVSVPDAFIRDYFIRLGKDSDDRIDADVQLAGAAAGTAVRIEIPELNVDRTQITFTFIRYFISIAAASDFMITGSPINMIVSLFPDSRVNPLIRFSYSRYDTCFFSSIACKRTSINPRIGVPVT